MKLTLKDKRTFARAVMADVPRENYSEMSHKLLTDWLVDQMPEKVRAVWDDPTTRDYIDTNECYMFDKCFTVYSVALIPGKKIDEGVLAGMQNIVRMANVRDVDRNSLYRKVDALICSCTTLKNALSILPEELHKYLPIARDGSVAKNVPVVIDDTVAALKAAGWPTNKGENYE